MNSAKLAACATNCLSTIRRASLCYPPNREERKAGSDSFREACGNDGVKEAVVVAFGLESLHVCV